ncbi:MAG: PhoH family protein [Actinomycetaceae bacterium]|nr:PhoH family protein [Actinomycetaceae bacterium]
MVEKREKTHQLIIPEHIDMVAFLGENDEILRCLERSIAPVRLHLRGNVLTLTGMNDGLLLSYVHLLEELLHLVESGEVLRVPDVMQAVGIMRSGYEKPTELMESDILSAKGRAIRPKTMGQKKYVDAIDNHDIVFGIGPAGTGKTYLAVAKAVVALNKREVSRIILTRPAVEAGESLGFLPGTLSEKINPYLRPLYDAMHDMLDVDGLPQLLEAGTIEVAPLAYMRGRTLNDAFIILDEAQNTTREQMKMFLTRLGFSSRMVITGDDTQVDLVGRKESGLVHAQNVLKNVSGIEFIHLTSEDVVRHSLVGDIIHAYSQYDVRRRNER